MACESQVPPIEGVGGTAWSPISKAKICLSDGAAGLGLGWPMLDLCWGYNSLNGPMLTHLGAMLGPSAVYVGARFAHFGAMLTHLGSMLGPGSNILELSRGLVAPPEVILG